MKRYENGFPRQLQGIDFSTLEESAQSVFGLSPELTLNYFNQAWMNFSNNNGGEPGISTRFPLGANLKQAISGEIADFYMKKYEEVLQTGNVWNHEYECSSYDQYRLFHQITFPLKNKAGLIVVNSLTVDLPMQEIKRISCSPIEELYRQPSGFITQCSNCRRSQRAFQAEIWDWVPEWIRQAPPKISHSICPICSDYYWKYG
ncbi:MAG: hypothetical protein V4714_11150 [Bacteroidota bacterium]